MTGVLTGKRVGRYAKARVDNLRSQRRGYEI